MDDNSIFSNLVGDTGSKGLDVSTQKKPNQLIASLSQPFDNIGSNVSRTYSNFSGGNILKGLADTYELAHNPTGGWGADATNKSSTSNDSKSNSSDDNSPKFRPEHLNPPNADGISTFNSHGDDFIDSHMQNYSPQSQSVGIPEVPGMSDQSQGSGGTGLLGGSKSISGLLAVLGL